MATTPDPSARAPRRVIWAAAAAGATAVLAVGITSLARGADEASPTVPFWPSISVQGSEADPPQDVEAITKRSDAVFLAHVTDVIEGRQPTSLDDPTPVAAAPGAPMTPSVFVVLTVDRVVSGPVTEGSTVKLEMASPPSPLTPDTLRSRMPSGQMLFFLVNSASQAKRSGFTNPVIQLRERDIWLPASGKGLIAAGPSGLYEVLHPHEEDTAFIQSFQADTLEEAATRSAQARR